jgi:hypothetical protein
MEKKSIYLAIILAVVFLLIGFGVGNFYGKMLAEKFGRGNWQRKKKKLNGGNLNWKCFTLLCQKKFIQSLEK